MTKHTEFIEYKANLTKGVAISFSHGGQAVLQDVLVCGMKMRAIRANGAQRDFFNYGQRGGIFMEKQTGFLRMSDGAAIYYACEGAGQPLVLVHGWQCSSAFWARNVAELSGEFQVVTLDLRGHGKSSKGLQGHTIERYAQDVREVIEQLGLTDCLLMGWSLGGPTMLSYWKQFHQDSRLAGLGLIDMTPFPFSDEAWNFHGLRGYNAEGFNGLVARITKDRAQYAADFTKSMFRGGVVPEDCRWMQDAIQQIPTWIAVAIYSDYVYSDFTAVLPTISVPTVVMAANSAVFSDSLAQGRHIAAQIPNAVFVPFTESGHALFYEESEKFNQAVRDFSARTAR